MKVIAIILLLFGINLLKDILSGLVQDLSHLRPESYMQNILGYQGDNNLNKNMLRSYFGDAILSWIDCTDVAEMAAHCLLSPNQHTGNTY